MSMALRRKLFKQNSIIILYSDIRFLTVKLILANICQNEALCFLISDFPVVFIHSQERKF